MVDRADAQVLREEERIVSIDQDIQPECGLIVLKVGLQAARKEMSDYLFPDCNWSYGGGPNRYAGANRTVLTQDDWQSRQSAAVNTSSSSC